MRIHLNPKSTIPKPYIAIDRCVTLSIRFGMTPDQRSVCRGVRRSLSVLGGANRPLTVIPDDHLIAEFSMIGLVLSEESSR